MAKSLVILWVDMTLTPSLGNVVDAMGAIFDVRHCASQDHFRHYLQKIRPDVVGFDFDYPDESGLEFARKAKSDFSSFPMIMATIQHSEALAIWAFRSGLADYLVKPISIEDLAECHSRLATMVAARADQAPRRLARNRIATPADALSIPPARDKAFLPAIYYVARNYHQKIQVSAVAKLCGMSESRFSRGFRQAFGITFQDYLVRSRLRSACHLLESPGATVTDVAFAVGFNDVSYFSRTFKRYFGVSPSAIGEDRETIADVTGELRIPKRLAGDSVH